MDPAKRICLKNLPDSCTKRQIAQLIRNRTGTTIHSIDLGEDSEGRTRRYAHFSCEGAKHVLQLLGDGIMLRSKLVHALPAKPHYMYKYAEARRKRQRDQAAAQEANKLYWEHVRAMMQKRGTLGEISAKRKTRNFYETRRRYAQIASQIAESYRAKHKKIREARRNENNKSQVTNANNISSNSSYLSRTKNYQLDGNANTCSIVNDANAVHLPSTSSSNQQQVTLLSSSSPSAPSFAGNGERQKRGKVTKQQNNKVNRKSKASGKRQQRSNAKDELSSATSAPAIVVGTPQPNRDERKLSGLQAKLAALKQKLAKK